MELKKPQKNLSSKELFLAKCKRSLENKIALEDALIKNESFKDVAEKRGFRLFCPI